MPIVANQGIRIHYEVEGQGPPLVLQHGFTDSLLGWYERGYVDALKQRYHLILVDARGHHLSDKPHDADAYATEIHVADVLAVLDDLDIRRAHYYGYSMGGWIGFGLAQHAPHRMGSMIFGGASPLAAPAGAADPMMPSLMKGAPGVCSFYEGFLTPTLEADPEWYRNGLRSHFNELG
jgi:pimeloyl-ACP methyl ester carboxylesterase